MCNQIHTYCRDVWSMRLLVQIPGRILRLTIGHLMSPAGLPRHRENKSIFPDRENTGNLLKNIKNMFLHREFTTNTGKI